jgi:acyl carrier protein
MNPAGKITEFIVENFLLGAGSSLNPKASLLQTGIVDSTGIMEIVGFLEQTFGIHVDDEDLVPENLDSVDGITRYIERKSNANSGS